MTYLHDYITSRNTLRKDVIPKLLAALMPTMDMLKYEYEWLREGKATDGAEVDSILVHLPEGTLPEGYRLRIEFSPVTQAPWKAPDGTTKEGPGF